MFSINEKLVSGLVFVACSVILDIKQRFAVPADIKLFHRFGILRHQKAAGTHSCRNGRKDGFFLLC